MITMIESGRGVVLPHSLVFLCCLAAGGETAAGMRKRGDRHSPPLIMNPVIHRDHDHVFNFLGSSTHTHRPMMHTHTDRYTDRSNQQIRQENDDRMEEMREIVVSNKNKGERPCVPPGG